MIRRRKPLVKDQVDPVVQPFKPRKQMHDSTEFRVHTSRAQVPSKKNGQALLDAGVLGGGVEGSGRSMGLREGDRSVPGFRSSHHRNDRSRRSKASDTSDTQVCYYQCCTLVVEL